MISRVIEAKADEMRAFLEEAAGISRYKERRRETESRIGHTRENLARLSDLRDEVEKQLRHLQRQAATARRYQALKQEERQLHAELLALRLREVETEAGARQAIMSERDLALQAALADQRSIEAAIERARREHDAQGEVLSEVQGRYYQVGAEISRSEQAIEHARQIRGQQRQELAQVVQGLDEAGAHRRRDAELAAELEVALAELGPGLDTARAAEDRSAAMLADCESQMHAWQERWETFNQSLRETSSTAEAERARLGEMDIQLKRLAEHRERVGQEHGTLSAADVAARIDELERAEAEARAGLESARSRIDGLVATLQEERSRERELAEASQAARRETQDVEGRVVSLEALQRAALGQGQGKVVDWLAARGLNANQRLAQQLSVDSGWERAVETVLGSYLEAVCVDSIDDVAGMLESLSSGTVTFFAVGRGGASAGHASATLRARVQGPAGLDALFEGIAAADTLAEALAARPRLRAGQSVITRDGIWIGPDWLRVSRDRDVHEGVIEREHELRRQRGELDRLAARHLDLEGQLERHRAGIRDTEDRLAADQARLSQTGAEHMGLRSQLDGMRARAEQRGARMQQLAAELAELEGALEVATAGNRSARARLGEAIDAMAGLDDRRKILEGERDSLRQALADARRQAEEQRNAAREVAIRVESRRASHESLRAGIARLEGQIGQFAARRTDLETQLATGESAEAELRQTLEAALSRRVTVEEELAAAGARWTRWTRACGSSTSAAWAPRPPCSRRASCSRT